MRWSGAKVSATKNCASERSLARSAMHYAPPMAGWRAEGMSRRSGKKKGRRGVVARRWAGSAAGPHRPAREGERESTRGMGGKMFSFFFLNTYVYICIYIYTYTHTYTYAQWKEFGIFQKALSGSKNYLNPFKGDQNNCLV